MQYNVPTHNEHDFNMSWICNVVRLSFVYSSIVNAGIHSKY